jgi:hypothetical protein
MNTLRQVFDSLVIQLLSSWWVHLLTAQMPLLGVK